MSEEKPLKLILLDDVREVRQLIANFLTPHGIIVRSAATVADLLHALRAEQFEVALLDILLLDDSTIGEAYDLFSELFPKVSFEHRQVLSDLVLTPDDTVSGKYILPMLKAISPETEVMMLTNTWDGLEDEDFLKRWGSYITLQKLAPDEMFRDQPQKLKGLDLDLIKYLQGIRREKEEPFT